MTQDEKDLIDEKFKGVTTLINAQFQAQGLVLDGINTHLVKLNGKVAEQELKIAGMVLEREANRQAQHDYVQNRAVACPHLPRITDLETNQKIGISKKQLIVSILSIIAVIISIALGSIKLNESMRSKQLQEVVKTDSLLIVKHK